MLLSKRGQVEDMAKAAHRRETAHLESRTQWKAWLSRRLLGDELVSGGPLSQELLLDAGALYARAGTAVIEMFIDGHLQNNAWHDQHPDIKLSGRWSMWHGTSGPYTYISADGRAGRTVAELPKEVDPASVIVKRPPGRYVSISDRLEVLAELIETLPGAGDDPDRARGTAIACRNALQAIDASNVASMWAEFQLAVGSLVVAVDHGSPQNLLADALDRTIDLAREAYEAFATHAELVAVSDMLGRLYSAVDPVQGRAHVKTACEPHDTAMRAASHAYWNALEVGKERVVEAIAEALIDETADAVQLALAADKLDVFYQRLHEAAPAAVAAVVVYGTINAHRRQKGVASDRLKRAENAAEEWKVRLDGAFEHAIDLLDRPTYSIQTEALRRTRHKRGELAAKQLAREFSVVYLHYPKFMIPHLLSNGGE